MIFDMIIKVILIGLCVCALNVILRPTQNAFVIIINIGYIVLIGLMILDSATRLINDIADLFGNMSGMSKIFQCLYKGTVICILTKISSDVCKESGNTVVSDIIDISGRIMLLIIAYPFMVSVIKTASAFAL